MEELEGFTGAILPNTSPAESAQAGLVLGTETCGNVTGSTTFCYRDVGGGLRWGLSSNEASTMAAWKPRLRPSLSSGVCGVVSKGLEESAGREPAE